VVHWFVLSISRLEYESNLWEFLLLVCCKYPGLCYIQCFNSLLTDALAIYLLNLLLAFLQPKFDPSLQEDLLADEIEEGGEDTQATPLPSQRDDEFRPFVRRLPEWQFWCVQTYAFTPTAIVLI
jgi:hypothetical protein